MDNFIRYLRLVLSVSEDEKEKRAITRLIDAIENSTCTDEFWYSVWESEDSPSPWGSSSGGFGFCLRGIVLYGHPEGRVEILAGGVDVSVDAAREAGVFDTLGYTDLLNEIGRLGVSVSPIESLIEFAEHA